MTLAAKVSTERIECMSMQKLMAKYLASSSVDYVPTSALLR